MVGMAKWLTHRIVIPTYVGSKPITHPILKQVEKLGFTWLFVFAPSRFRLPRLASDPNVGGTDPGMIDHQSAPSNLFPKRL